MLDFYHFANLRNYSSLKHLVSSKNSTKPYNFSLALHTGEDAATIIKNRQFIARVLGKDLHFVVANQTHSDHIHIVTSQITQGWHSAEEAITNCDALITQQRGVVLTILTADCVPILLYDPIHEVIAAVHAGWKGTQAKIVAKTVHKMIEIYDSKAEEMIAGIAPSIGKCCYEVGEDVAIHFKAFSNAYTRIGDKYLLDLPTINQQQLLDAGLIQQHIEMSNICTACEVERFFSYRKEQGCSGRFMSMIMLKDSDEN